MAGARLMVLLVLPCLLSLPCSAEYSITRETRHTLKAFRRQDRAGFLRVEWSGKDGPFNVSFTGKSTGPGTGTEFLFKLYQNGSSSSNSSISSSHYYTIHPAEWPGYVLATVGKRLVAKEAEISTTELTDKNYQFVTMDHGFVFVNDKKEEVLHELTVIISKARDRAIKSAKGGRVVWSSNWKDCGTWIYLSL